MRTRRAVMAGICAILLAWGAGSAAGAGVPAAFSGIDWRALIQTLRLAFGGWKISIVVPAAATATPTISATPSRTGTATRSPTVTRTGTRTPTVTRTRTATPSPTASRTSTRTRTPTLTPSATPTATNTATRTNTRTPTNTFTRTFTRIPTATATPTATTNPALFTPTPAGDGQLNIVAADGIPPQQKLASAMVMFPYVVSTVETGGTQDTRIELVNLSSSPQTLQCFFVRMADCVEVGFMVSLTAQQPLTWLASQGTNNVLTFTAVPPFDGVGQLQCAVMPQQQTVTAHNVLQGRAIVFDNTAGPTSGGETIAYGAIGFQRLVPGSFTGVVDLDGGVYESCPDRLHFQALATDTVSSDLVLVPCAEDLLNQVPVSTAVQLAIVNEFEQVFSSSFSFKCQTVSSFGRIGPLSRAILGSQTMHLVVRGVSSPLVGLVVDRFDALGQRQTSVNEPFLEGGRPATIIFP